MEHRKFKKGFSLIEVLVVLGLMAILVTVSIPPTTKYYRTYKYREYAYSMESLIKWSRLTAMERTVNVGVCVNSGTRTIRIVNMGTSRTGICTGDTLNTLKIEDEFVSLSGNGVAFDPRSFSIFNGNVCISDGTAKHFKVVVSRFGAMRIDSGPGGC